MRVSGAAKVQWRAPHRKMGEFLELPHEIAQQQAQTHRTESRVTPTYMIAALCWFPYATLVYRAACVRCRASRGRHAR